MIIAFRIRPYFVMIKTSGIFSLLYQPKILKERGVSIHFYMLEETFYEKRAIIYQYRNNNVLFFEDDQKDTTSIRGMNKCLVEHTCGSENIHRIRLNGEIRFDICG